MKATDFGPITLSHGAHESPKHGMCFMEMAAFLSGEEWTDSPACVCPLLAAYSRALNDNMPQKWRDKLQRLVPAVIGTRAPEYEKERAEHFAWAAIKIFAPIALDARGFQSYAEKLRNFEGDLNSASDASDAAYIARTVADAARSAANSANAVYSAADAARAAANAANAVYAAAHAALAVADAARDAADAAFPEAIRVLEEAIAIGATEPAVIAPDRVRDLQEALGV